MFNILKEPLIAIATAEGIRQASLPEVYAALMADDVEAFPALRPHQRHAWHAFLVQLGAMAMHRAGIGEPPAEAAEWAALIRGLTPDFPDDEPWQLVVEDITRPAFMQPPARSADKLADYKNRVETADELDMLVTSKNHDLKATVVSQAGMDDWAFALVTLQTMEGFGGSGNYGISRMNGGLGSRPAFTLAPSGGLGAHVRRDSIALLEKRQSLLNDYPMTDGGAGLLWTMAWDGTPSESLLVTRLDPFYIEICRRIRLRSDAAGQLYGIRTSSRAARVAARELKGRTGDPWTPCNGKRDGLPLTLGNGGFTYKRVTEYLTDWQHPVLLTATPAELRSKEPTQLVARAMVRGQGKTEGYYERIIPLKPSVLNKVFGRATGAHELGEIAKSRIEQVGIIQRILSHAIQTFAARGDGENVSPEHRQLARPWLNRLDEVVDTRFFDDLQAEFEVDDAAERTRIRNQWLRNGKDGVVDHARNILHDAEDALPCPAIHRYRARVNAEGLFEGRMRGNSGLPFLFDEQGDDDDD